MPRCQFLRSARMTGLSIPKGYMAGRPTTAAPRVDDAVCGKPAEWSLTFGDFDPIWVCDEHYEVLIGQGWSVA